MLQTQGIHHITAIVGDAQENYDFYRHVLGLRLIKKTVNFDDPETYHLYFGNESGAPGTVITFFPWKDARKGITGTGQVGITTYAVPPRSLAFWEARLQAFHVAYIKSVRFNETYLSFTDPHGLHIELTEKADGPLNAAVHPEIPDAFAIRGFAGALLLSSDPQATETVLVNVLGLKKIGQEDDLRRFVSSAALGSTIDVKLSPVRRGSMGVGTVHHIAFRAKNEAEHLLWREQVIEAGFRPTEVRDRKYFKALYFREPGGILIEIASDEPGFTVDESPAELGLHLMLPPQYEAMRSQLEQSLPPIQY